MIGRRLAVVGLGLIGGSAIKALAAAGAFSEISGFDPDPAQREAASHCGALSEVCDSALGAVRGADLVLIAVPVLRTAEALASILPGLAPGAVVSDVGSTKRSVIDDVARVCGGLPGWFVPGHPIAGTEKSGIANAFSTLFRGRRVVLTPQAATDPAALGRVRRLWEACGARVVEMDPGQHDAVFAATSHLPHVLAYSFVDMLAGLDERDAIFTNAGGGFRDFTRIASSSPRMWHDIVQANAPAVLALLDRQLGELQTVRAMIAGGRWSELQDLFERARAARERHLGQIE